MKRTSAGLLVAGLSIAVLVGAFSSNPVNVSRIRAKNPPAGVKALTGDQSGTLLVALGEPDYCQANNLVDPSIPLNATGRRFGLLAIRRQDIDLVSGLWPSLASLWREGVGLKRVDETKTTAGLRTIPLP